MKPDAIVVGAGIVGACCADALARRGLRVLVLERGIPAGGTTGAGMGHVVVMENPEVEFQITSYSVRLWRELAATMPPDCEDDPCGTLWVAEDDEEMEHARRQAETFHARGLPADLISSQDLASFEPALRPGLAGGLFLPEDRVVYPPAVTRFLLERVIARGGELRLGVEVGEAAGGRVRGDFGSIEAPVVINAAGAYAPRLTPGVPIEPRKGHLVITDRHPGLIRHQLVELGYLKSAHGDEAASVAMNVQPRRTGQILIGSSREFVGWDPSIHRAVRARMLRRASALIPVLSSLSAIRSWVGFRPATADKLPLLGEWEPGLFMDAGHEGLGITLAPASAEIVADLVTGAKPAIDATPFTPHREMAHA